MLTGTYPRATTAPEFAWRAGAWSLGIFGLLRLSWLEGAIVLPTTQFQSTVAVALFGTPTLPIEVTLACSGTEVMALCLGAVLAYPAKWHSRLAGAACGIALILILNTLRIGTLGRAASSAATFNLLHVLVWPTVLTLAVAGYVFAWMRIADRRDGSPVGERPQPSRRFIGLTLGFLLVFALCSPLYLNSPTVLSLASFIAGATAVILSVAGVSAHATANVLSAPGGNFLVTQECIVTPLVPLYLAAICVYSTSARRLVLGVVALLPLFTALGVVRLLLVALPEVVGSPVFFVHAFYQLLLGAVVVFIAALWRRDRSVAAGYALAGITAGFLFVYLLGPAYTQMAASLSSPLDDPQGAIGFLPVFQAGLYVALSVAALLIVDWKAAVAGFAVLGLTQALLLLALQAIAQAGAAAHVRDIRGWAIAGPVLIVGVVAHASRPRR